MSNLDPYLMHAFDSAEEQVGSEIREGQRPPDRPVRLPMLVQVTDAFWQNEGVPDLEIKSRIGNILSCNGSRQTLRALREDPNVISIEGSRRALPIDTARSLSYVKANTVHHRYTEDGSNCIVAMIDDGIDVLHEAFQDSQGNTRILEIWDQTDPTGPAPSFIYASGLQSHTITYGTVHTMADINSYIQKGSVQFGLGRNPKGHGTHVASIVAGRPTRNFAGGIAPNSMLLVVISKVKPNRDEDPLSVGYSDSHVDALAYISNFVRDYNKSQGKKYPVVTNLSQGMNAGAHDGTSLLESAFDEFTQNGRTPGWVIVKSAGNTRDKYIHAKLEMSPNDQDKLEWFTEEEHIGPDVVELWFNASDHFTFSLRDPNGNTSKQKVSWSYLSSSHMFPSLNTADISLTRYHHDNGDSCLQVTVRKGNHHTILPGVWTLQIESMQVPLGGRIHAWLERDDRSSVQFRNHLDEEMTLSIPGTARSVICVSAIDTTSNPGTLNTPSYSAYGRTRDERKKPDLAAPGHGIEAARAGTLDNVISMNGTSMAAPHVAGAIALLLSYWGKHMPTREQLTANQICAALTQGAQHFNPMWNRGRGYGILNVESLIETFL